MADDWQDTVDQEPTATSVRVFETRVLHASDVIYWLDGAAGQEESRMPRVGSRLVVRFTQRPRDLKWLSRPGQMAFWRPSGDFVFPGAATEAQRTRPPVTPFAVAGFVSDTEGRFNPRAFSVTLGSGSGHAVAIYPSPSGVRWPASGGLLGTLRRDAAGSPPAPWAVLELEVTLSATDTMTFRGQAAANGDFALPLSGLPPLPEGVLAYHARLGVLADLAASANTPVDPALLDPVLAGGLLADGFHQKIELDIHPGEVRRVNSFQKQFLAVKATTG